MRLTDRFVGTAAVIIILYYFPSVFQSSSVDLAESTQCVPMFFQGGIPYRRTTIISHESYVTIIFDRGTLSTDEISILA